MREKSDKIISCFFLILAFSICVSILFTKQKKFSENENRYLNTAPKFSFASMVDGTYPKKVEKYVDDQFPFRDGLLSIKTKIQKKMGNMDINGVYLCEDRYLIEKVTEEDFSYKTLLSNVSFIEKFKEKNQDKEVFFMPVPTASLILKDKLPRYASVFDQDKVIEEIKKQAKGVNIIDVRESLWAHKKEYIYYRLDHHWTTLGAYYAYKAFIGEKDVEGDFRTREVTKKFKGSLYSKVLDNSLGADSIVLYDIPTKKYSVSYEYGKKQRSSVYDLTALKEKDKYKVFLGGNDGEVTIQTGQVEKENILIVKDSFANSFIPFLLEEYAQIHVVDLRYFSHNLREYMEENDIDKVLFLYNVLNLSRDKNLYKLGMGKTRNENV